MPPIKKGVQLKQPVYICTNEQESYSTYFRWMGLR